MGTKCSRFQRGASPNARLRLSACSPVGMVGPTMRLSYEGRAIASGLFCTGMNVRAGFNYISLEYRVGQRVSDDKNPRVNKHVAKPRPQQRAGSLIQPRPIAASDGHTE